MNILFIIGIILIRNLVGRSYSHVFSNNCSRAYFDAATLNYMASFKFVSENINGSCPNAKAIAFSKSDLLEVEMELVIVDSIWRSLNKTDQLHLKYELRNRLHFSCNSISFRKELCRSEHAFDGGVFVSVYDGSLVHHPYQKSCSICLLKSVSERLDLRHSDDFSQVLSHVNLSLSDIIDWRELQSDDLLSVKFVRSRNERHKNVDNLIGLVLGASFPNQFALFSDLVTYNIKVRLRSGESHISSRKGENNSKECLFRCDWSSRCLPSVKSICDDRVDCRYGDDENTLLCKLYNSLNENRTNSSARRVFSYNAVQDKVPQNDDYLKLLVPVIISVTLVMVVIGTISCYFHYKRKHTINKTMCNISKVEFSEVHNNSLYLHKSSMDEFIEQPLVHGRIDCCQDKCGLSKLCAESIQQKLKNNNQKHFIHPKSFRKPNRCGKYSMEQYSGLCNQINYPDTRTRSNWLRAYFQLSRSNNGHHNKPPVLNVSHFPPVSFRCKL